MSDIEQLYRTIEANAVARMTPEQLEAYKAYPRELVRNMINLGATARMNEVRALVSPPDDARTAARKRRNGERNDRLEVETRCATYALIQSVSREQARRIVANFGKSRRQ
ncbi:hypothetical protein CKO28_18850 [Rhodovibrio sodomensis]|uniref:Uncharacterized protein n=1 Tax=Rhodovibrio sodomensis TaxID=1088 RepID=A0ABS1DKR7_9PROT|nr:hypothetical protein [Rhodovibrio sodomensis]MBK1670098.1 hypothetical protein [Rhodovibrio sodomensis]